MGSNGDLMKSTDDNLGVAGSLWAVMGFYGI